MDQNSQQILATNLIGKNAIHEEKQVGEVEDILLDKNGRIVGVVLGVGGFLGVGEKQVALPWEKVIVSTTGNKPEVRVAMTEEQLKAAPYFEPAEPKPAEPKPAQPVPGAGGKPPTLPKE